MVYAAFGSNPQRKYELKHISEELPCIDLMVYAACGHTLSAKCELTEYSIELEDDGIRCIC